MRVVQLCAYVLFVLAIAVDIRSSKASLWPNSFVASPAVMKPKAMATDSNSSRSAVDLSPAVDRFARLASDDPEYVARIFSSNSPPKGPDPFAMVANDLLSLRDTVKELLVGENALLTMAASHFFDQRLGKRFRPTLVAVLGRCLLHGASPLQDASDQRQKRVLQLAQIIEMIHVASLIHDDILDESDLRRGGPTIHKAYSNKVAVLAGDYLLAKASTLLARLQRCDVVEIVSASLDALVQGEVLQARSTPAQQADMQFYLRKTYFKTASLIAAACRACALLVDFQDSLVAEEFGYHLGMAYQIIDDVLDFTGLSSSLGKPAQADLSSGIITAPVLFAMQEVLELRPLAQRRFAGRGDVARAMELAKKTECVSRSYELAQFHASRALDALHRFPACDARNALERLVHMAVFRSK